MRALPSRTGDCVDGECRTGTGKRETGRREVFWPLGYGSTGDRERERVREGERKRQTKAAAVAPKALPSLLILPTPTATHRSCSGHVTQPHPHLNPTVIWGALYPVGLIRPPVVCVPLNSSPFALPPAPTVQSGTCTVL